MGSLSESVSLTLPYPISSNRYWRTYMPKGFKAPVTTVSPEAKAYRNQVLLLARRAGILRPLPGRVSVHIRLYPARPLDWRKRQAADPHGWDTSVRCLDIDNARKVLYDSLKEVVFEDDRMVWRDSAERMIPDGGPARVEVVINALEIVCQPVEVSDWRFYGH